MNKKSLIATALLALAGVAGISSYPTVVRAEAIPVKDLTLVQEEESEEIADPEMNQYYYGGYRRYHRGYHGYRRGYRGHYGRGYSYYGGYRRYYGGYRSYHGYGPYSQDDISTEGIETPEVEENK